MSTGGSERVAEPEMTTVPTLALHILNKLNDDHSKVTQSLLDGKDREIKVLRDLVAHMGNALHGFQYRKPPAFNEVEGLLELSRIHGEFSDQPEELL